MAEETANSTSFPVGRLVAIALAIVLAVLAYFLLQQTRGTETGGPAGAEALPALGIASGVTECETRRLAEIGEAVADGMLNEETAELSRNRIRARCRQLN